MVCLQSTSPESILVFSFFSFFFFFCLRSEKAFFVCAVFPSPFVLGTKKKKCFFWVWGGKKEEEMKIVSVCAVCLCSLVYLSLFSCSSNIGSTEKWLLSTECIRTKAGEMKTL